MSVNGIGTGLGVVSGGLETDAGGGGAVPAPAIPTLGTPVALSSTSLRAYFTWAADAEKIYLSIAPALTGVYGSDILMAAGVYQYDFTGLTAGTAYFIRARAWNTTAYSAYATAVTGTTRTTTGIEQALWNTFKTKMQADAYLAAYIVKWKFNREANILAESKFPVLKAWIVDTSEDWKGVPKSKIVRCRVIIHGIVKVKDSTNLETEKLKFDEYVKNAIEADMTFDGGVTMNIVGDTIFSNLDDSTAEIGMQCEILSNRFTAGER